jgi:hypothetical protein
MLRRTVACLSVTLLLLSFPFSSSSQQLEFGLIVGTTNYSGELSSAKINWQMWRPALGLLARYNASPRIALKGHAIYGEIAGADSLSSKGSERARNLSFKSGLFEVSAQVEFNLVRYDFNDKNGNYHKVIPYLYTGIAVYKYNPLARYAGQWWELQTLGTEGQGTTQFQGRKKYALTQISLPFGAGVKIEFTKRLNIGIEVGARMTFNDYLDDVSKTYVDTSYIRAAYGPVAAALSDRSNEHNGGVNAFVAGQKRGNSSDMDWYYFAGFYVTYKLQTKRDICPKF